MQVQMSLQKGHFHEIRSTLTCPLQTGLVTPALVEMETGMGQGQLHKWLWLTSPDRMHAELTTLKSAKAVTEFGPGRLHKLLRLTSPNRLHSEWMTLKSGTVQGRLHTWLQVEMEGMT